MTKQVKTISRFVGGIADSDRESLISDAYAFGQSIDIRTNPQNITLLPRTVKESGSVVTALPKWAEYNSTSGNTYVYDEAGNIYKRTSAGSYSKLHTVANSHGNGLAYFGEDDFLYYTSDKLIGRYGNLSSSSPQFVDDFFGSQGGTPLNTNALDLESSSSQYASRADTASLSITGNLSIEAQIKPESLPTSGNTMTIVSKWDESGSTRSYKFGIGTNSNFFGDGSDGALTISSNTTDDPIDSACTGTSGAYTLSATNASFAAGQVIFIHQSQGSGVGANQRNKIQSYTAGTITLVEPLNATYTTGAQVLVLKQYTTVTVNSGITWTAKAWNGTTGGILGFLANSTVTISGTITAVGKGFRGGGTVTGINQTGRQGEGHLAAGGTISPSANGSGGGGGKGILDNSGGGGGGHATAGGTGDFRGTGGGIGGSGSIGSADLTTLVFGGGGGGGGTEGDFNATSAAGGNGGGAILIWGTTVTVTGSVTANGANGGNGSGPESAGGGGGAGGAVWLKTQVGTLGTTLITAVGGAGGTGNAGGGTAIYAPGGDGRIHLDYLTSYTGTTNPTLNATVDNTLGSSDGYTLFLSISSTGSNTETFTKPALLETGKWQHVAVTWQQSTRTAELFLNAVSLGTVTGSLTAIHDNASRFAVGANYNGAGAAANFYDGIIDEVRVWAGVRTSDDYLYGINQQINPASAGLQAYYYLNNDYTDATANANTLTATNSPVFVTDVPFSSPTTRLDIDQSATTSGNTYTLPTAITETSADKKTFTPAKDPQKSLAVYISAKGAGTGSWTLTVHDSFNNTIASKTVAKSALSTGLYEFVFDDVWRPLTNFTNTYHFHLTDSDGTGTVRTTNLNDLSGVTFTTYYQFLVEDTAFHPIAKMLQFLVFGNERYVAKLEATLYEPNKIVLPAGYHVRCFGYWGEYLAIGAIRGATITEQDSGRIYFWDGIAPTYNFFIDVPEGGVNALLGAKGDLYIWAGYQGDMLVYQGGNTAEKIKRLPKIESDKYVEVFPGAVTMWKALVRFGISGNSDSTGIYKGIYTFGHTNIRYPEVLTFDYPISTGTTQGTGLRIGMTLPVNKRLLIGWADGTGYGVDYVDAANDCYPTGTIEFLFEDNNIIWKEKVSNTFVAKTSSLTSGQSISLKYKADDDTMWTTAEQVTSASPDPTLSRFIITNERFYESQIAVDIASTSGVSPTLKGVGYEVDLKESERRV